MRCSARIRGLRAAAVHQTKCFISEQILIDLSRPPSLRRPSRSIVEAMKLGDYNFEHVCDIEPMRNPDGTLTQFMPQGRYRNARNVALNTYGAGPFCKFKISGYFDVSGVYVMTVDTELRYIGECANLSKRFNMGYGNISPKNCFKGGQETNCRLNNLLYTAALAGGRISLWFLKTAHYKSVEAQLRRALNPPWNRT